MKIKTLCLVIATAIAMPTLALAGPAEGKKTAPAAPALTDADKAILEHRHHVNLMEIEMGKLAQQRATTPVKQYGAILVRDHTAADKTALALAKARGVKLADHPTAATNEEQEAHKRSMDLMERLRTLEGEAFDREYVPAMVDGHEKEHARVTVEITVVADAKLKALLEKTLPSLRKHADAARALQGSVATAPKSGTPPPGLPAPAPSPKPAPPAPKPAPTQPTPKPTPGPSQPTPAQPPAQVAPKPAPQAKAPPPAVLRDHLRSADLITELK